MHARTLSIARSFAIIGATGALILGATFALEVGATKITGNTLTASAGLQIAPDGGESGAGTFGTALSGFDFGSLVPNSNGSTHGLFWMKNTTGQDVTLSAVATNVSGFENMDKTKVMVHVRTTGGEITSDNLAHLSTSGIALAETVPANGNDTKFEAWVSLEMGALNSGTVSGNGGFDLEFSASTP